MIFVTVGHQMPFDRLVRAVDEWAASCARKDVFAQIGRSEFQPKAITVQQFLSPEEFDRRIDEASAIIAHAGTGTIIAALQRGKPLLVVPRLARFGETRNDHQVPTARHFAKAGFVLAEENDQALAGRMEELAGFRPRSTLGGIASKELIGAIRQFTFGEPDSSR